MRKKFILNPNFHNFDAIINRYINKHIKNFVESSVRFVLSLLTTTNCVGYIRLTPTSNLEHCFNFSRNLIVSTIKEDR